MRAGVAEAAANGRGSEPSFVYDAFISYDHDDQPVAEGIHRGLHRIGRRMGKLHALRVFRDSTDLSAAPDLQYIGSSPTTTPPTSGSAGPTGSPEYNRGRVPPNGVVHYSRRGRPANLR